MIRVNEMSILMAENKFYKFPVVLYQIPVNAHTEFNRIAASPERFHLFVGILWLAGHMVSELLINDVSDIP